jgi:hypothetical protein
MLFPTFFFWFKLRYRFSEKYCLRNKNNTNYFSVENFLSLLTKYYFQFKASFDVNFLQNLWQFCDNTHHLIVFSNSSIVVFLSVMSFCIHLFKAINFIISKSVTIMWNITLKRIVLKLNVFLCFHVIFGFLELLDQLFAFFNLFSNVFSTLKEFCFNLFEVFSDFILVLVKFLFQLLSFMKFILKIIFLFLWINLWFVSSRELCGQQILVIILL